MTREIKTIREATEEWVREMNAVPQSMIAALMKVDIDVWYDEWEEVTEPAVGDRVYVDVDGCGEIVSIEEPAEDNELDETSYEIELDRGETVFCSRDEFNVKYDDVLPIWGTMWSFKDPCDEWWLESGDGIRKMSECGFRIYHHDKYGYWFGIDGAGYSFYDEHWIPLYKIRVLHWHEIGEEEE